MDIMKKTILVCGIHYNVDRGGGNQRNNLLLENFSKTNLIILSFENSSDKDKFLEFKKIPNLIEQFIYSLKILYRKDIEAIYCHHYIFCFLKLFRRTRVVYEIHSLKTNSNLLYQTFRLLSYIIADKLIVLSSAAKKIMIENRFINSNKIIVVLNGKK